MDSISTISEKVFSICVEEEVLTSSQLLTSQICSSFFSQAFDGMNLLGICSGNFLGSCAKLYSSKVFSVLLKENSWITRSGSLLIDCLTEAAGIELIPSLFKKGGMEEERFQGFAHLSLTLLLMKGVGCAKISNPILRHGVQDGVMVEFNRLCGVIGLTDIQPTGFIEGMVHAEAMSFQMSVGVCFVRQGIPELTCIEAKQELEYKFKTPPSTKSRKFLETVSSLFSVPSKIPQLAMVEGVSIENIPLRTEVSEGVKIKDLHCKMELFGEAQSSAIPKPFAGKIQELKNLHDISQAGAEKLVSKVQQDLERFLQGTGSRVAVHFLRPSEFCKMAADSLEQFKNFLETHFTPQELKYLGKVYTDPTNATPKAFGVLAGVCAAKKAAIELLDLPFQNHAREIRFSFGRPKLTGEAWDKLDIQGLFTSESCDGDLAIGISVLETSLTQSGYLGFGVDLTSRRVRYTTPEKHARQEAAYKAVLSEHPVRQYNAKTGSELIEFSPGSFVFTGKSAFTTGIMRRETNPSPLAFIDIADFQIEQTIGAMAAIPLRKGMRMSVPTHLLETLSGETFFKFSSSVPRKNRVEGIDSIEKERGIVGLSDAPFLVTFPKIYFKGKLLENSLKDLELVFSQIKGEKVSAARMIALLSPMIPGYRLRRVLFDRDSIGIFSFEGEVVDENSRLVARFGRMIVANYDPQNWAPSIAGEYGLTVFEGKNSGIGSILTLNHLLFFRELKTDCLVLSIGEEGGGFWPERGFDFPDSSVLEKMKGALQGYAATKEISFSSATLNQIAQAKHAWELSRITLENGRNIGKEFFLHLKSGWNLKFDLHPSYPGWQVLRKSLRKIGLHSLLPDELGNEM